MKAPRSLVILRMILELTALTGAIVLVAVFALTAAILPRPYVPYNAEPGFVSDYGMGAILTALFAIGEGLMGVLIMLSRFPKLYRSPVVLNAGNIEIQYVLSKIMLSSLQIVCAVYFSILLMSVYRMRIQIESNQFLFFSVSALAICALIYLLYFIAAKRYK